MGRRDREGEKIATPGAKYYSRRGGDRFQLRLLM